MRLSRKDFTLLTGYRSLKEFNIAHKDTPIDPEWVGANEWVPSEEAYLKLKEDKDRKMFLYFSLCSLFLLATLAGKLFLQ